VDKNKICGQKRLSTNYTDVHKFITGYLCKFVLICENLRIKNKSNLWTKRKTNLWTKTTTMKRAIMQPYLYPLSSQYPSYKGLPSAAAVNLAVTTRIADQVISLPIYPDFGFENIERIMKIIHG
jgi:dTDP-4-amino-4,6-dideoxygalactose transaminase